MSKSKKQTSRMVKALLETADDMRRGELIEKEAHDALTMRHLGPQALVRVEAVTEKDVKAIQTSWK